MHKSDRINQITSKLFQKSTIFIKMRHLKIHFLFVFFLTFFFLKLQELYFKNGWFKVLNQRFSKWDRRISTCSFDTDWRFFTLLTIDIPIMFLHWIWNMDLAGGFTGLLQVVDFISSLWYVMEVSPYVNSFRFCWPQTVISYILIVSLNKAVGFQFFFCLSKALQSFLIFPIIYNIVILA